MAGDPTLDPDFMKAAPHDQMAYLAHTDPDFAKASPQDQMGYLMHIRGLSPSISGPGKAAAPQMQPSNLATALGSDNGPSSAIANPQQPAEQFALNNPDQQGKFLAASAVGATGAAAPYAAPFVAPIAKAGMNLIKAHPIATMAAIEAAKQLPGTAGKIAGHIPSWLPLMAGSPEPEPSPTSAPPLRWNPEAEAAPGVSAPPVKWNPQTQQPELAAPPPVRWPQTAEPQQTSAAPPPIRWADKAPSRALEDIKTQATVGTAAGAVRDTEIMAQLGRDHPEWTLSQRLQEAAKIANPSASPYQVVQLGGAKAPAVQGSDPFSGPRAPAQMEAAQSTTIQSHGYHGDSQTMTVQFKNGKVYEYRGVPQKVYNQYQQSESQGSFFSNNIKGRYQTRLLGAVKPTPGQQVSQNLGERQ